METLAESGAFIAVPLINESGRPAKANLSLDSGLLEAIDDTARASGLTRSIFITFCYDVRFLKRVAFLRYDFRRSLFTRINFMIKYEYIFLSS